MELYVWPDVAIVHLLCAVPLAVLVAAVIRCRIAPSGCMALAVGLFGASVFSLLSAVRDNLDVAWHSETPFGLLLMRCLPALGLALSVALIAGVLLAARRSQGPSEKRRHGPAEWVLAIVAFVLLPWTYVSARSRHEIARLGEFLEQGRIGEAYALAQGLVGLGVGGECNGQPLPDVAANVERRVQSLEARVATPLGPGASRGDRLNRARDFAMLGRTNEALEVLEAVPEPAARAEVENLRGTIYEARGEWDVALRAYQEAKAAWETRPPTSRAAGLLRATTGIAFCQRKMGHYDQAEATYHQVLALAPTADSHFLLAQFYEDAQHAEKSRSHARRAMALAPARYQQEGEKLIRKLSMFHFGCLGVFAAESAADGFR